MELNQIFRGTIAVFYLFSQLFFLKMLEHKKIDTKKSRIKLLIFLTWLLYTSLFITIYLNI